MADFCRDCTAHLRGEQYADRNDLRMDDRSNPDDYIYMDLCDCCGWGHFDQIGSRIRSRDEGPVEGCECPVFPESA